MCHSTNPKNSWWSHSHSIKYGGVVWDKRAKNVEKKPSDVRYCYCYNKPNSKFVSIQWKSLFSMNFPCKHLCEFVFVETIVLLLTMCESICWYALYKKVQDINNSQNQTLISFLPNRRCLFLVILVLITSTWFLNI